MAIDAVKRFREVVSETPELKDEPALAPLRARLLKEPQAFFRRLRDRLEADRETTPDSLARLASANYELGYLTNQIGDKREAGRSFEESLSIRERLARDHPSIARFQSDLAEVLFKVGYMRGRMGRPLEAREPLERALAIRERLAQDNPLDARFQNDLARGYAQVGYTEAESGRPEEALALYEQFRAIMERLARDHPSVPAYQRGIAQTYSEVATMLRESGRVVEALALQEKAHAIRERLARENPRSTQSQFDLAWSYNKMAHIQIRSVGRPAAGVARAGHRDPRAGRAHDQFLGHHVPSRPGLELPQHRRRSNAGRTADLLESIKKALAIMERQGARQPSVPAYWGANWPTPRTTSPPWSRKRRAAEAMALNEQARRDPRAVASDYPAVLVFQARPGRESQQHRRHPAEGGPDGGGALAAYEKALAIMETAAATTPA